MSMFLKRKIDNFLAEWKKNPDKLTLIIKCARQIGKTFSIENFGKQYKSFIEINFITEPEYKTIFSGKTFEKPVVIMNERIKRFVSEFILQDKNIFEKKAMIYSVIAEFMKESNLKDSTTAQNDTLRRSMIYISKHYTEDITLNKVASEIGVTPVHLSRTLSGASVMCFTDIVNCLRLKEAKRLLEQTDMPISELAYEAGFGSIRNFNRLFEKYFKCMPKDIRNESVKVNFLVRGGVVEE